MASGLPTEIVTVILSNLGQSDLLSCRLVNQSWNRESLLVFRKSSFTTHLNICKSGGNVNKYIKFVSTKNPQLVLPIHLSLKGFQLPHSKTVEIVTSLQTLTGPDSIQSFTLFICCKTEEDDKTVMTLLSKISHALKTLEIKHYYVESTEQLLLDLMKDLIFPNVMSLKYLIGTQHRFMEVQSQFIRKCPKLTELCLHSETPELTFPTTLQKLVLVSFTDILKFCNNILECSHLHSLEIYIYEGGDREIVVSILESLEKTLKSLTMRVDPMFLFPRLPCLESLTLHGTEEMCTMIGLNPDRIHLNSENLPSLKFVDLPFIFYIRSESPLPSVKTLTLSLSANCKKPNPTVNPDSKTNFLKQEYFKNVKILFPNATTICLKQTTPDRFQFKTVLKELICSDLAPQIEQIQIEGVKRDILGEVMEQNMVPPQISMLYSGHRDHETEARIQKTFELWTGKIGIEGIEYKDEGAGYAKRIVFSERSQSGHKMTNVKIVKIVFGEHGKGVHGKFSDFKLNLMAMARNFPGLTEIEIFGIRRELYSKEFHDLAVEYPNLLLRISKN